MPILAGLHLEELYALWIHVIVKNKNVVVVLEDEDVWLVGLVQPQQVAEGPSALISEPVGGG
jgi:hypothetical protein